MHRRTSPAAVSCAVVLAFAGGAVAQPDPCAAALAEAERLYQEQDYAGVEPAVSTCIDSAGAGPDDVQESYRLLALSLIRQGQFPEARLTVVRMLGANYDYRPDPVYDPPSYVALVAAVKDQLRVGEGGRVAVDLNAASEGELARVDGLGPDLARRIVAHRAEHGPFATLGALIDVPGVTPRIIERIADAVTVGS